MNKCETVQDLVGEVLDVIIAQGLGRLQDPFQVRVHVVEDDVHVVRAVGTEKDVSNADDVLMVH